MKIGTAYRMRERLKKKVGHKMPRFAPFGIFTMEKCGIREKYENGHIWPKLERSLILIHESERTSEHRI